MEKSITFFDTEVGVSDKKIKDIGAVRNDGEILHTASVSEFWNFILDCDWLCGHNAVEHDIKYLPEYIGNKFVGRIIDTLYLSPLLFPKKPYHRLLKDDKLRSDELNNPVNDSKKAKDLFFDEVQAFHELPERLKTIFIGLLYQFDEFRAFFDYVEFRPNGNITVQIIKDEFRGLICENADLNALVRHYPRELAFALALIHTDDRLSVTPPWIQYNFPKIDNALKFLCNTPCKEGCDYCKRRLDVHRGLKEYFGYEHFRCYNGEPLQENAARAAIEGKSLLAVFPTGGGKSVTFQLPALMAGRNAHGLTVVISPLQSLMKDQVDNLASKGIEDAVTINGMLDPIERANAIERAMGGKISLLYISPEMLRSKTIDRLLMSRNVVRFVIDEAHCFSAWGQDFRVDYQFIGDFIRELQNNKMSNKKPIPVSCFTATAKQKVIADIREYFNKKLGLHLDIYASSATRENLHYTVLFKGSDEEKYNALRSLIAEKHCPTIVYVSRTKRTRDLAGKLTKDGLKALPFNGKMDSRDKIANQEAFMNGAVSVIVATSAFGMGVDKSDVGLVVHFDISDSLENYVQEAGRAGRDPKLSADCYVLFNNGDLDKHFILLNQTKLSICEIQQVWKTIKNLTKNRAKICCSPLEIAREAGWDDTAGPEMETRVKTAIAALENAGYIIRGKNVPHVYASSIRVENMAEASDCIRSSALFSEKQKENAIRIIKSLISSRSQSNAGTDDSESRIDYLADILGIEKSAVIESINLMRSEGLLMDYNDISAYIFESDSQRKSKQILERFTKLERFIIDKIGEGGVSFNFKKLNDEAQSAGITTANVKNIRTILGFLTIKGYIVKEEQRDIFSATASPALDYQTLVKKFEQRLDLCRFALNELFSKAELMDNKSEEEKPVNFSSVGLLKKYESLHMDSDKAFPLTLSDIETALLYLSKIGALKIEGGFLVLYNGMEIKRVVMDNRIKYKVEDYRLLDEFYKQRIRQIHIVGEYANLIVKDYNAALQFVKDYFHMDFRKFIAMYFKGERANEIERNITPEKYYEIIGNASEIQAEIIADGKSKHIVVAAGPGSGKTRVLVQKLASLMMLEDVKHEKLLMVTFSRAAATEFKKRLLALIGDSANYIEIKTFHSYCFDLLGKIGSLEESVDVVKDASEKIRHEEVEQGRITKSVLVIDEAQDMDEHEFELVTALMEINEDMRVIAVGDDDQNIYAFRGSDSKYMRTLIDKYGARMYEMTENYRSCRSVVAFANAFANSITERMKTVPCEAMSEKEGLVKIVRHISPNMEEAVVKDLTANDKCGKTCVLTGTNEEALRILGLLNRYGKRAKLIQSFDGFRLNNLLEVRFFLDEIERASKSPIITDDIWKTATTETLNRFHDSACMENIKRMFADFDAVYAKKYRTDLEEFIGTSAYEDFYDESEADTVFVSTIHKSKGREFDNVYMMVKNYRIASDKERRPLYVGITRAKSQLCIHTNTDIFENYQNMGIVYERDECVYDEPTEIVLQTTHRDVVLDFFRDKKEIIYSLRSGMSLTADGAFLSVEYQGRTVRVAKFSKSFMNTVNDLNGKGYALSGVTLQFIVKWKGKEDTDETPVLLLNVKFARN